MDAKSHFIPFGRCIEKRVAQMRALIPFFRQYTC